MGRLVSARRGGCRRGRAASLRVPCPPTAVHHRSRRRRAGRSGHVDPAYARALAGCKTVGLAALLRGVALELPAAPIAFVQELFRAARLSVDACSTPSARPISSATS
jgi:hypothetical protein